MDLRNSSVITRQIMSTTCRIISMSSTSRSSGERAAARKPAALWWHRTTHRVNMSGHVSSSWNTTDVYMPGSHVRIKCVLRLFGRRGAGGSVVFWFARLLRVYLNLISMSLNISRFFFYEAPFALKNY